MFIEMIDSFGPPGRTLAALGIGLDSEAHLIGNVLEDEKVAGNVHVALGDNSTFGGDVVAGIHLDGIITGPTVYLDGEPIQLPGCSSCISGRMSVGLLLMSVISMFLEPTDLKPGKYMYHMKQE